MIDGFDFEEEGRTFTCKVEAPRANRPQAWWWFSVSGDGQRYAPFPAVPEDTRESVQARIVKYYTDLVTRRSMPAEARTQWWQRGKKTEPTQPS